MPATLLPQTTWLIDSVEVDRALQYSYDNNVMSMTLYTYGDNDSGDCYHSGAYFSIEVDISS